MLADPKLVRDQFLAAAELPAAERAAYLSANFGGDAELRAAVERLLDAHEQPAGILNRPVLEGLGQTQAFISSERPGMLIAGRYKLLEAIGEGGMGTVWVAEQTEPVRRKVALKLIKAGMDSKSVVARFEAERQALAVMDHPNIAKVLDGGLTETGRPFFVMEYVKGVPMTEYCDANRLSVPERLNLFVQVCQAVQHAHQKGIIHRDLKPSNILVAPYDDKPVPKVIDFGLAKAMHQSLTERTLHTAHETVLGTPLYMSPEQAQLNNIDVDTRSDIYSLGVLLYELLTGTTPLEKQRYKEAAWDEVRRIIREEEPPRPSTRLSTAQALPSLAAGRHSEPGRLTKLVRGELDWIVMKALEKDRARRYETANGFALDLQRYLVGEPVLAAPPSIRYRLRKVARKHRAALTTAAIIALLLVAGVAISTWQAVRANVALHELRETAPAFAEQARALAASENFDEALDKLAYAAKLRPDAPEYLIAKGDLLQCQFRLAEAATAYRAALALRPGDARARSSVALCDELLAASPGKDAKLSRESLSKLHLAMQQQQRPAAELMPVARLLGKENNLVVAYWLDRLKDLPISADKPLSQRLTVRDDGFLALDLSETKIVDLAPLTGAPLAVLNTAGASELTNIAPLSGMKLVELNLAKTKVVDLTPLTKMQSLERLALNSTRVSDLSPLKGLRLRFVDLTGCPIRDISSLRSSPLEELFVRETRVTDLTPLVGMPLKQLDLALAPVVDFKPLTGLPLEMCNFYGCHLNDLSVLRGMPIRELLLWNCPSARNYAVLRDIGTLELLKLPSTYLQLPENELEAIASLRNHPKLRQLDSKVILDHTTTQPKEFFWQDWDRVQPLFAALRKSGFGYKVSNGQNGTFGVSLERQPLSDLSFLAGTPISELWLNGCQVADLAPIQDLPLRVLGLQGNPVVNIGPLQKMPLEALSLEQTKVSDLSPLTGLQLKSLYLHNCQKLTDVSALAEIPTLVSLTVPVQGQNIEKLRKLPNLKFLAYGMSDRAPYIPLSTTAQFWTRWAHLSWMRALNDAGMKYTANQDSEGTWAVAVTAKEFTDCSVFNGAQIRELTLDETSVTDLAPLAGLPLKMLVLRRTPVADYSIIGEFALRELKLNDVNVTDISFLRRAPLCNSLERLWLEKLQAVDYSPIAACKQLRVFSAWESSLADLAPLRGLRLRELYLAGSQVSDISPLAEMPLERIFFDLLPITDITPLLSVPSLKDVILPMTAEKIDALRKLPNLQRVSYSYDDKARGPSMTANEFWIDLANNAWLPRLRDSGVKIHWLRRLPNGTWEVDLSQSTISDLEVLRSTPISKLFLLETDISDLKPLRGMPLTHLSLYRTKVADLSPLEGMPLNYLYLSATKVTDLSVLRGMPLTSLKLNECTEVTDLSPLQEVKTLTTITLPRGAKKFEFLRDFPNLKRIGYAEDASHDYRPDKTAEEFWAEYDANKM